MKRLVPFLLLLWALALPCSAATYTAVVTISNAGSYELVGPSFPNAYQDGSWAYPVYTGPAPLPVGGTVTAVFNNVSSSGWIQIQGTAHGGSTNWGWNGAIGPGCPANFVFSTTNLNPLYVIYPGGEPILQFQTAQSGRFSDPATWVGGVVPGCLGTNALWVINAGHTVLYDTNNMLGPGWGASQVYGTLVMSNTVPCFFKMCGWLTGPGSWLVGSTNEPIQFGSDNLPTVVIEFTNSAQCKLTGPRAVQWYGDTSHLWSGTLGGFALANTNRLGVPNIPSCIGSNDVYFLPRATATPGRAGEYFCVSNVVGSLLYFMTSTTLINQMNWTWTSAAPSSSMTVARSNGAPIFFISLPIVVREPVARGYPIFTDSVSNVLAGVRVQALAHMLATNVTGWTLVSNVFNVMNGVASNRCDYWTAIGNTVVNGGNGALAGSLCHNWRADSNAIINTLSGGLARDYCTNWVANNNLVLNVQAGGLAFNGCSGWSVTGNVAMASTTGALAYAVSPSSPCANWTAVSNRVYGSFYGMANGGHSWTAIGNTVSNCAWGGLAANCNNWLAISNVALACTNGGLLYSGNGWVGYGNTITNCTNGGLAYLGNQCVFIGSTAANCTNGAISYGGLGVTAIGSTLVNCTAGACVGSASGGVAMGEVQLVNTTNVSSSPLLYGCTDAKRLNSPSGGDIKVSGPPWSTFQQDATQWLSDYGCVTWTNTPFPAYAHQIWAANRPVPWNLHFSVRPGGTRTVTVKCYATNQVAYYASLQLGEGAAPAAQVLACPAAASGGWTNVPLSWVNATAVPQSVTVWVEARASAVAGEVDGFTAVDLGPDDRTAVQ